MEALEHRRPLQLTAGPVPLPPARRTEPVSTAHLLTAARGNASLAGTPLPPPVPAP